MKTLHDLTLKIVEAVPIIAAHAESRDINGMWICPKCGKEPSDYESNPDCQFSDITLDDVLIAFKAKFKDAYIKWNADNGTKGFYIYTGTDSALFAFVEFGKPLSQQSPALWDFLLKLI